MSRFRMPMFAFTLCCVLVTIGCHTKPPRSPRILGSYRPGAVAAPPLNSKTPIDVPSAPVATPTPAVPVSPAYAVPAQPAPAAVAVPAPTGVAVPGPAPAPAAAVPQPGYGAPQQQQPYQQQQPAQQQQQPAQPNNYGQGSSTRRNSTPEPLPQRDFEEFEEFEEFDSNRRS